MSKEFPTTDSLKDKITQLNKQHHSSQFVLNNGFAGSMSPIEWPAQLWLSKKLIVRNKLIRDSFILALTTIMMNEGDNTHTHMGDPILIITVPLNTFIP